MGERYDITLGGAPVLAVGSQGWTFMSGTASPRRSFFVHEDAWGAIAGKLGGEVEMVIGDRRIQRLVLIEEAPSPRPHHRVVVVGDIRFWWERKIVLRDYNIRRRRNQYALRGPKLEQLKTPISEWGFRPSTMKDGKEPWHARTAIEDVLELVEPGNWQIDSLPTVLEKHVTSESGDGVLGRVTLNDIRLRDPGDVAVGRMLAEAPGAALWVDASGKVRVFDATDLQEQSDFLASISGPETVLGGLPTFVDRSRIRPKSVAIYFEREIELISRSKTEGEPPPSHTEPVDAETEAELLNVAPSPDPRIVDAQTGSTIILGTYRPISVLVDGWELERQSDADIDPEGAAAGQLPWSLENIRKHYLESGMEAIWGGHGDFQSQGSGQRRVSCIRTHWRRTYQIEEKLMDRLERVAPIRLAIMDDFTRTRAPATVFATYAVLQSNKGVYLAKRRQDAMTAMILNVDAYPNLDGGETWDSYEGVASAMLRLLDPELGVFHIDYVPDPYGKLATILPGYLVRDTDSASPEAEPQTMLRALRWQDKEPVILGGRVGEADGMCLYAGYKVAFIYSAVQGAPNGKGRFHKVTITPTQIREELRAEYNVGSSSGPEWEMYAPPALCTARWALEGGEFFMGDYLTALNELLGITAPKANEAKKDSNAGGGSGAPGTQGGASDPQGASGGGGAGGASDPKKDDAKKDEPPDPVEETKKPWALLNRGHMMAWAVSQATAVYANLADRVEGEPVYHESSMPNDLRLSGGVGSVSVQGISSGRVVAHVSLDGPRYNIDPMALVPQWARTQLLGVLLDGAQP